MMFFLFGGFAAAIFVRGLGLGEVVVFRFRAGIGLAGSSGTLLTIRGLRRAGVGRRGDGFESAIFLLDVRGSGEK